jgi:hypothetical protein
MVSKLKAKGLVTGKLRLAVTGAALTLFMAAFLFSCNPANDDNPADDNPIKGCTVTFNTNGGSVVPSQQVVPGGRAVRPSPNPARGGFTFNRWYRDNNTFNQPYDFNDTVNADICSTGSFQMAKDERASLGLLRLSATGL